MHEQQIAERRVTHLGSVETACFVQGLRLREKIQNVRRNRLPLEWAVPPEDGLECRRALKVLKYSAMRRRCDCGEPVFLGPQHTPQCREGMTFLTHDPNATSMRVLQSR